MKNLAIVLLILASLWPSLNGQEVIIARRRASSGGATFTVIQSTVSAVSGTWTATITPGATGRLIAGTGLFGSAGCVVTSVVSDTSTNSWTIDDTFADAATGFTFITFHAFANATVSTVVTATHGACTGGSIALAEVSGVTAIDSPSIAHASSGPSSTPTLNMTTLHTNEFCAVQGNLINNPGGYTSTWAQLQPMITGGGLGGQQWVFGPSTGTATQLLSTAAYGTWALTGACYK